MSNAMDNIQQVEERVLQYRSQICQVISASKVLCWMPNYLSAEDEREIKSIDTQSPEKAAFLLLKHISSCKGLGKWQAFLQALKEADYPYLVSLLDSGQSSEQSVYQKKMLQIFAPYLELQLEPCDLIAHLLSSDLIDKRDMQEIQACQRNGSSVSATMLMLDRIQRRQAPSKWYTDFLKILHQKGFRDIVYEMEPEFSLNCEKLKSPKLLVTDSSDSDIDKDDYGYNIEQKIEAKVRYFQSEITELVKVDKIAPALCQLIGIEKVCQIMRLKRSSQKESIESMLEEIGKLRSKVRWRSFIRCLNDSDYPHLADLLSRPRASKNQNKERNILRLFHSTLGEQLEPVDLISHLEKDSAINHYDKEEILTTLQQSGKTAASLVLIGCLQCRLAPAQWFTAFMNALRACDRDDLVSSLHSEYINNDTEVEKGNDSIEANSSEDSDLLDRIDAAHCHIYSLEKSAKQELGKLQEHFDALKSNMSERIENKSIALTKNLENVIERRQEVGLQQELETSLEQVMSTSYTVCDVDHFMNLTKLATLQESERFVKRNHFCDVPKQYDKQRETKLNSSKKRATLMSRRRCVSESSSCSSSSSGYLMVTNSNTLSTSSDSLSVDEGHWKKHVSKVRFADGNETIREKHQNIKHEQEHNHYMSQYAMKKTSRDRRRTLSESSVLSTDASIVSSTDRAPSSSLTNSLTETSNLSSTTKTTSVSEKKVLIERTESYLFHHKKVLNCKEKCVLSSVCVLPKIQQFYSIRVNVLNYIYMMIQNVQS